jgi:hypothetical protein
VASSCFSGVARTRQYKLPQHHCSARDTSRPAKPRANLAGAEQAA